MKEYPKKELLSYYVGWRVYIKRSLFKKETYEIYLRDPSYMNEGAVYVYIIKGGEDKDKSLADKFVGLNGSSINENHSIAVEDLNVKGMIKNRKLSKSIHDVGWGMFLDMLKYKTEWTGKNILQIGRFEPSTKTCSTCGYKNVNLTLKDRTWTCPSCGEEHDRDINVAINIKNFALKKYMLSGTDNKNREELPTSVGALTHEAAPL